MAYAVIIGERFIVMAKQYFGISIFGEKFMQQNVPQYVEYRVRKHF